MLNILLRLLEGMGTTAAIFVLTLALSLPLGLLVAFCRRSRIRSLAWLTKIYISIMRGTPLILQIVVVYFGPYYLFGIPISLAYRFPAVIIAFTINYAAYFAEIYRAGIESIDKGQYEAAQVLGYTKGQTFFKIILPQVIKRVLPPVTNEAITLVKDTSIAQVISCAEMFTVARELSAAQTNVGILFAAGLFYYIFNYAVAYGMERIERRFAYYS